MNEAGPWKSYLRKAFAAVDAVQIFERLFQTSDELIFAFTQPLAWIVVLLVWDIVAVRVTQLSLQVAFVGFVVFQNTLPCRPLHVGVDIHLDRTVVDGFANLFTR